MERKDADSYIFSPIVSLCDLKEKMSTHTFSTLFKIACTCHIHPEQFSPNCYVKDMRVDSHHHSNFIRQS